MARKPRIHFPGALYHVMCRGNQGPSIFKDDRDRQRYLDFLKESQRRFDFRVYAYVLMGNYVHHVIEIGQVTLADEFVSNPELRVSVKTISESLRKGRRAKRSIRLA